MRAHLLARHALALALAATLATLLLCVACGTPAAAATKSGHDFVYYNDTVIGHRYYCTGNSGGWGTITSFFVETPWTVEEGRRPSSFLRWDLRGAPRCSNYAIACRRGTLRPRTTGRDGAIAEG